MKTYSEMLRYDNYNDRLEYLYIGDKIGHETFGNVRWLNQRLYTSPEWRRIRNLVILRDNGCDLGIEGCELSRSRILIHHINPITEFDIVNRSSCIFDLENLISISHRSHNYVHFGIKEVELSMERKPNDTCPWRR